MSSRFDSIALLPSNGLRTLRAALADLLSTVRFRSIGVWHVLCTFRRRARERAELRSLSRRDILDLCPKGTEADREMNKPFWRA
jgi:uncharacterized protein YjiS (DUF1127 family)